MNYIQKIKRLYKLSETENYGFSKEEMIALEKKLEVKLPAKFKEYYQELGKEEKLNYVYNNLLLPGDGIEFSEDDFLVFYEENQKVIISGSKKDDLVKDNPPVYGNYDTIEKLDWEIETQTIEDFSLMMAIYRGTFGKLRHSGNFIGKIDAEMVKKVQQKWNLIAEISKDNQKIYYEENQNAVIWGIKKEDLAKENPPVYGNYDTIEKSDWEIETQTTEDFFLMMAIYNGTFGGLQYNGTFIGEIDAEMVKKVEEKWILIPEISRDNQKIYTDDFYDVISLSFDKNNNCTTVFIGTSDQNRFDAILDVIDIDWEYLSYDDEEYDEDEENED